MATLLYCPTCKRHTPHESLVLQYASRCTVCNCQTSQLMRNQAESITGPKLTAPDGTAAIVVENNPKEVTFYVPSGDHQGYYHHDKLTGKNSIAG